MTEDASTMLPAAVTTPAMVFQQDELADVLIRHIESVIAAHKPDLTTDKGRKDIASLAFKVARTKTAIDEAGKALGDDARDLLAKINAKRSKFKEQLQALQDRARAPLDEWQAREDARTETIKALKAKLESAGIVLLSDTAASVRKRLLELRAMEIPGDDVLQNFNVIIRSLRNSAEATLSAAYERLVVGEAEKAELDRLRREAAEREQRDAEAAAAAERERQQEVQRAAEAEAADRAKRQAEEQAAAAEADRKAAEERAAEQAAQAERDRIAREQAEAQAAENARRADEANRKRVIEEAAADIATLTTLSAKTARVVVDTILAGNVRHIIVKF